VSLRGILLAEYKILYGINVASQAADDHVQCVLQRTLNTVQDLVLSQENVPQTHRTTRQIERSSRCCQILGVCKGTSSYSSRTAHLHTVHWTPSSCYDMKPPDFIGPAVWPANSPDLNPVDYRIWGLIQERVYQTAIRDTDDLKQCLTCVWAELKQSVVDRAIEQWRPRLRACIRAKGQHFEQLLNWILHFLV